MAKDQSEKWGEKKEFKLSDFRPQRKNANKHTQRGMGMLEESIQSCGFLTPMTAAASGEIIDGSARLETVYSSLPGDPIVIDHDGTRPIVMRRIDILTADDEKAVKLGILANRVAQANLEFDPEVLLDAENSGAIELTRIFNQPELDLLFSTVEPEIVNEDDEDAVADDIEEIQSGESESRVTPGQIWQMGRHRVYCGDSTDKGALAILFEAERADCCWTDPPYGVAYIGKTEEKLKIQNDTLSGDAFDDFLSDSFSAIAEVALYEGSPVYVAHPAGPLQINFMTQFAKHITFRQQLVWVKSSFALGRSDYHYRHEPILLGYTPGGEGRRGRGSDNWHGSNSADSIFEVQKPNSSREHPTMKPPALIQRMLANSAGPRSLIFDPFLGSGSTIVAAHQMLGDRKVYGCELDPVYAEVILRRYERITGQEATLFDTI